MFPDYDVKNRVDLTFELDNFVTSVIDEYVHDYRPSLMRGSNEDWLFPGVAGGSKGRISSDCRFESPCINFGMRQPPST
jgi:hypothetical protein